MDFYNTRHACKKDHPNAIVRKVIKGQGHGQYVAFYDWTTYLNNKRRGFVR